MTMSQVAKLLTLIFFFLLVVLLMMSLYCTQLAFAWIDFRPLYDLIVVVVVDISIS